VDLKAADVKNSLEVFGILAEAAVLAMRDAPFECPRPTRARLRSDVVVRGHEIDSIQLRAPRAIAKSVCPY